MPMSFVQFKTGPGPRGGGDPEVPPDQELPGAPSKPKSCRLRDPPAADRAGPGVFHKSSQINIATN